MGPMRRKGVAVTGLLGLVLLAVLLAVWVMWTGKGATQASLGAVVTTVAIDMDPSAAPANDEDTVGTIERCAEVANTEGTTFQVDVVLDAIPNFGAGRTNDLAGFDYDLHFPGGTANITAQTHWDGPAGTVTILDRAAGSGSNISFTEAVPDADGSHQVVEADFGAAETGPGGVLGRYTFTVQTGAASGVYYLTMDTVAVGDADGLEVWDAPGDGVDKDQDGSVDEDILLDGAAGYGLVALGVACPPAGQGARAPTPTASPEPSPQPTCKPTPPPPKAPTGPVRYRWANVSIEQPPFAGLRTITVSREFLPEGYSPSPGTMVPCLRIFRHLVVGDHEEYSGVYVDATTGQVVHEEVRPEDRAEFDAVLATLRFEGTDPPDVWPYSGTPPEGRRQAANITYIEPDPASGIKFGFGLGDYDFPPPTPRATRVWVVISNSRSTRYIDAETGKVMVGEPVFDQVDERDREAFDRLTSTIEVVCQ
jgi:hypothetical protein